MTRWLLLTVDIDNRTTNIAIFRTRAAGISYFENDYRRNAHDGYFSTGYDERHDFTDHTEWRGWTDVILKPIESFE